MKKIVFITGTRADFSKIKSLMNKVESSNDFELFIFVTGMHMSKNFGLTYREIEKCGFRNIYKFINHDQYYQANLALSATIDGFFKFVSEIEPDLIVVHGDRIEPLGGAIVGALSNILVAHIEGGELSGTIDESLRHAISKLAHIHLVNDELAKKRLLQMGEHEDSIFIIGSPDLDLLHTDISLACAKEYYGIDYDCYAIAILHPVTTHRQMRQCAQIFVDCLKESQRNYIVIYPNNDLGFELILQSYEDLKGLSHFKIFPSLRFEYFICLLKGADFIIGNSSCILKEAVYLGKKGINIGDRQNQRTGLEQVINVPFDKEAILQAIMQDWPIKDKSLPSPLKSDGIFFEYLQSGKFFAIKKQKAFQDRL